MNKSLVIDMGVKLITRAAVLIAIFSLATGDALIYPQCTARAGAKKETIVVELSVEGFMDLAKRELIFEAGSNGVGGGGVSPPWGVENWRYGMSVISVKKHQAMVRLVLTLIGPDGTEKKIAEQFLVVRGKIKESRFAHGVNVKHILRKRH